MNSGLEYKIYKNIKGLIGFSISNQISKAEVSEKYYSSMLGFYDLKNNQVNNLKRNEFGWLAGVGYEFNKRLSVYYSFQRSFNNLILIGGFHKKILSHNFTLQLNLYKNEKK